MFFNDDSSLENFGNSPMFFNDDSSLENLSKYPCSGIKTKWKCKFLRSVCKIGLSNRVLGQKQRESENVWEMSVKFG